MLDRVKDGGPCVASLQSRRFLTKTRRYIDRGRHLEKQRKRLRGRGGGSGEGRGGERFLPSPSPSPILNPSTSPLKSVFDSSQLSGSINVQDGGTTLKQFMDRAPKYACFAGFCKKKNKKNKNKKQ